mgnify:CR=1 FL=1
MADKDAKKGGEGGEGAAAAAPAAPVNFLPPPQPTTNKDNVDWCANMMWKSKDDISYTVSRKAATQSGLVSDATKDESEGDQTEVPITDVDGNTLKYIVQWIEYHKDAPMEEIEKPLKDKKIIKIKDDDETIVSAWDYLFLTTDLVRAGDIKQHDILVDVIMAANYLDIKPLLELSCAAMADIVRNKNRQELCDLFGIENDFTADEEKRAREQNSWQEEKAGAAAAAGGDAAKAGGGAAAGKK